MDLTAAKFAIAGLLLGFVLLESYHRRFVFPTLSTRKDTILDVVSVLIVPAVTIPAVLWTAAQLANELYPSAKDQWVGLSPWLMFGVLLLADDLTQYFWHRLSHTSWLYPLHRAHHSASYLSIRVVYRNNLIYYAFMPGLWFSGFLIHTGFMSVYPIYVLIKMTVIISAHSSVPWDEPLHRIKWLQPVMWCLERLISTPSTHSMHHGLHQDDGVTHYQGNYGNLLFIWDILFGTALITRKRPQHFGVEGLKPVSTSAELFWPTAAQKTATPSAHQEESVT